MSKRSSLTFREFKRGHLRVLAREGIGRADASDAIFLAWALRHLDETVFPDHPLPIVFAVGQKPEARGAIASYNSTVGHYAIYASNMHRLLQRHWHCQRIVCDKDAWPLVDGLAYLPTMLQLFTCIAAHEVRHRLQESRAGQLRLFTPAQLPSGHPVVAFLWEMRSRAYAQYCVDVQAQKYSAPITATLLSIAEFDAQIVERVVMHQFDWCETLDELAAWIRIQPPE